MAKQVLQVKIRGLEQLKAALKELEETFGKAAGEQVIRRALTEAGQPIVRDARSLAPDPRVRKSIRIVPLYVRQLTHTGRSKKRAIFAKHGNRYRKVRVAGAVSIRAMHPFAHWFEFGTGPRFTTGGAFRGRMPASPYMRPAWERHRHSITSDIAPLIWKHIQGVARKYRSRGVAKTRAQVNASLGRPASYRY